MAAGGQAETPLVVQNDAEEATVDDKAAVVIAEASEGRIVGVCPNRFEDAPCQGKQLTALSILNLPATSSGFSTGL